MKKITINLSYYNQTETLKTHIKEWASWDEEIRNQFHFCIVDDCSKIKATDVLSDVDLSNLNISIYRVKKDLVCNIAGVRNLSAQKCDTKWMVILDMDTLVPYDVAKSMIQLVDNTNKDGVCFKFNRIIPGGRKKPHPAVCLLRKNDYWNVGGCEEDLVGNYGYTDPSFWHRSNGKLEIIQRLDLCLKHMSDGAADIKRDRTHNAKIFEQKIQTNSWSTDYIRFDYERLL